MKDIFHKKTKSNNHDVSVEQENNKVRTRVEGFELDSKDFNHMHMIVKIYVAGKVSPQERIKKINLILETIDKLEI